ncbi:MAG: flagellar hook-basal body complex protein FliE [Burkholderiaceae bacterium]
MIDKISSASVQNMMEIIRSYESKAANGANQAADIKPPVANDIQQPQKVLPNFTESVKNLIDKVNETQTNATQLQEAYQRGEDIPLTDVVLSMQKSSLSFEATLQVRNKVLRAYEEIMNMPV